MITGRRGEGAVLARTTIRVGGYAPPTSTHGRALDHFAIKMAELVGDSVDVEILYNIMDRGRPATDLFSLLASGELTWIYFSTSYLDHAATNTLEIPFLFSTLAGAHAALDGPFGARISERIQEDTGHEMLGYWDNGFRHLTNSVRPIRTPADCAGLRIRLQPNDTHEALCGAWGMEPYGVELSRGVEMITRGEVDAQENPLANTVAYGIDHRHITLTGHLYGARGVIADAAHMTTLPNEVATAVRTAARSAVAFQRSVAADYERELQEQLAAEGREIVQPTRRQREQFRSAAADVIDAAMAAAPADLLGLLSATAQ